MAKLKLIIFLIYGIGYFVGGTTSGCSNSPMDVIFLLDSSDGSPTTLFDQEKQLSLRVMNDLWDGRNRFGLVTFGDRSYSQFNLNAYSDISEVQMAVQYIWQTTGQADVGRAIENTINNDFVTMKGGRVLAPDVLILITASDIRNEALVHKLSTSLQAAEIELYVILVGAHISQFWFEKLTTTDKILRVRDVQNLATSITDSLKGRLCTGRGVMRQWSAWTRCGASCGPGFRRRFRVCEKRHPDDLDCEGNLMVEEECLSKPCTEPVDGLWSLWDQWSRCSKTCKSGIRSRQRTCSAPLPTNGGKVCIGDNIQKQNCSVWSCPDCSRQCPHGSHLDQECTVCICSDVTLYGTVRSEEGRPILNAEIFLNSKLYDPLATTDYTGYFSVQGICIVNEVVTVKRDSYSPVELNPTMVNASHWTINATLLEYIEPVFTIHPEDKIRLTGQEATLCCQAVGFPMPTEYVWYHNNDPLENLGRNGTLHLGLLTLNNAGLYRCFTETSAGASKSNIGSLIIKDSPIDTCLNSYPLLEELPAGCHVKGDPNKNSTFDVRTCGKAKCVSREMHDNGTCSEWWHNHCCDAENNELVEIECEGFSFQKARVVSCKCKMCFEETMITGKVFGRLENGSTIPLRLGTITVNGKKVARTNTAGVFAFAVPKKITKLVMYFQDEVFNELVDTTKVVTVVSGTSSSISIALSVRPKPIPFDSSSDLDIEVGNSGGMIPVGKLSMEKDSLVTINGEPFRGTAKANVHFMDPRNLNDFEAANGEFSFNEDGNNCPLETFGVYSTKFEDSNGNPLIPNKPMKFEMDPTVFNISSNSDGQPDVELWRLDQNSGIWIPTGKTEYKVSPSRRRLLEQTIVGTADPPVNLPRLNLYDSHVSYITQTRVVAQTYEEYIKTGWWIFTNYDTKVTRTVYSTGYQSRTQTTTSVKPDACYVGVTVYKTLSGKEKDNGGTQIKAVTWDEKNKKYVGFDKKPTNEHGHVCLQILCNSIVYLSGEHKTDTTPLYAFPKQDIPYGYTASIHKNGTEVKFNSINFQSVDDPNTNTERYSPVYYFIDEKKCQASHTTDDYKFQFALSLTGETKHDLIKPENVFNNKLSWYPSPPEATTRKICFIKAGIKVQDNYDIRFIGTSYQGAIADNTTEYGTYNVGPIAEPTFSNMNDRAACIEFRCPGIVNDQGAISKDVDTLVVVHINPYPKVACRISSSAKDLNMTQTSDGKGFQFKAAAGRNYGPTYGVYIASDSKASVQRYCYQGVDTGSISVGMEPRKNTAVQFDCT